VHIALSDLKTKHYMPYLFIVPLPTYLASIIGVTLKLCVTDRPRSLKIVPFESFNTFLLCDAMHKGSLCRHVVSVCLFHIRGLCENE